MSAAPYCTESDIFAYALPRGSLTNPARLATSALASSNAVSLDVHGFVLNDALTFRAEQGGSLPAPLVAGVTYYADPLNDSAFLVLAAPGGSPIDLTTDGDSVLVITPLPFDRACSWASRLLDDMLPAHVVPLVAPYPEIIVMTAAELAGWKMAGRGGTRAAALSDIVDAAQKRITRWAAGVPVRGVNSPVPRANLSVSAAGSTSEAAAWRRFGGIC